MSDFEIYVFVLCLIVYLLLGGLSTAMLVHMYKLTKRLIDMGAEDEFIATEYQKQAKHAKLWAVLDKIVSAVLLAIMCLAFLFSAYMHATEDKRPNGIPSLKVVKSPSMSYVHKENKILDELGVNDRIQTYDLIVTRHLPGEYELELYDIVVYEADGITIIHRIVDIEEPNGEHPDCRWFVLQGDANAYPDRIPVYYSQMRGIYEGERIPFVGSFVLFMQSPAGWMCIILALVAAIAAPVMERKLKECKNKRLVHMGLLPPPETKEEEQ